MRRGPATAMVLFATITLAVGAGAAFLPDRAAAEEAPAAEKLAGAWKMVSMRFTYPDGRVAKQTEFPHTSKKILTNGHFAFGRQGAEGQATAGGGRYTVEGNTYTEHIEYHVHDPYVGTSISFRFRLKGDGDRWIIGGKLPNGIMIREVYERIKPDGQADVKEDNSK